jgi:hypothetical protein
VTVSVTFTVSVVFASYVWAALDVSALLDGFGLSFGFWLSFGFSPPSRPPSSRPMPPEPPRRPVAESWRLAGATRAMRDVSKS